jgi:hypothetical protein
LFHSHGNKNDRHGSQNLCHGNPDFEVLIAKGLNNNYQLLIPHSLSLIDGLFISENIQAGYPGVFSNKKAHPLARTGFWFLPLLVFLYSCIAVVGCFHQQQMYSFQPWLVLVLQVFGRNSRWRIFK